MKKAYVLLLISAAVLFSACMPVSSARSSENETREPSEIRSNTKTGASKNPTFDAENTDPPETETDLSVSDAKKQGNFVCPETKSPCLHPQKKFADWELSFRLPEQIVSYRKYSSEPFYAVILKRFDSGCGDLEAHPEAEAERLRLQRSFPSRKVFAEYDCREMSPVVYSFDGKKDETGSLRYANFIAVYAGASEAEAAEFLETINGKYPQAEIKKMTASYTFIEY